jgi:hypothetical protein
MVSSTKYDKEMLELFDVSVNLLRKIYLDKSTKEGRAIIQAQARKVAVTENGYTILARVPTTDSLTPEPSSRDLEEEISHVSNMGELINNEDGVSLVPYSSWLLSFDTGVYRQEKFSSRLKKLGRTT